MKTAEAELQQLQVAVATAEGWTEIEFIHGRTPDETVIRGWHPPIKWKHGKPYVFQAKSTLPNYPESRDAIIGAIVRRFADNHDAFAIALGRLVTLTLGAKWSASDYYFALATATAEQLCRAYCAAAGIPATP